MSARPAVTAPEVNAYLAEHFPGSIECVETAPYGATSRLKADQATLRPGQIISGPTLFALCDGVLWHGLFAAVGIEPMALTSELSIRFLRPARGTVVHARADLEHVGRRSVIGTVRCWMEDAPDVTVATAQGTYVRPR